MKTDQQVRLECFKAAASMCYSKVIGPAQVLQRAEEFYQWIIKEGASARDTAIARDKAWAMLYGDDRCTERADGDKTGDPDSQAAKRGL